MFESVEDYIDQHLCGRRVCIVGNAPFGPLDDHSFYIDRHDAVIRLNDFEYNEGRSGTKLTAWFVNHKRHDVSLRKRLSLSRIEMFSKLHGGEPPWHVFSPYADGEGGILRPSPELVGVYRKFGFNFVAPREVLSGSPLVDELRRRSVLGRHAQPSIGFQTCARLLVRGINARLIGFTNTQCTDLHDHGTELAILNERSDVICVPMSTSS